MQRFQSRFLLKLSALAAAVALQGAAYATSPVSSAPASAAAATTESTTAAPPADRPFAREHKRMRHHRHSVAMLIPGYGPVDDKLVQSLALNETQTRLLNDARTTQKELRQARRETARAAKKSQAEQLKAGAIDPRAAFGKSREAHQKAFDERQKVGEKWLAVWDSLNASQQQKVVAHFNDRAEKTASRSRHHGYH